MEYRIMEVARMYEFYEFVDGYGDALTINRGFDEDFIFEING